MVENKSLIPILSRELDKHNIDYMIIGGQAVLLYGEPRLTMDIDITVGIPPSEKSLIFKITDVLSLNILVNNPDQFIDETFVLPCESKEYKLRVDFIFSNSEYEKRALERVNIINIQDYNVKFASVEDLIIHKLIAGRARDIEDIRSIVLKNSNINFNYIYRELDEFSLILGKNFKAIFDSIINQ